MCTDKVNVQIMEDNMVTLPRDEYDMLLKKAFATDSIILHASIHTFQLDDEVIRAIIGVFLKQTNTDIANNPRGCDAE
ncbi:MAG: hypothetical protein ACI4WX_17225 [Aristaeellaceae bacterium]